MARRTVLGLFAGGVATVLGSCGSPRSASYRFRMTVEVETPTGVRSGSSVMEVRLRRGMAIGDMTGVTSVLRGEAVVVDLPNGPLFTLLQLPNGAPPLLSVVAEALLGKRSSGPDEVMTDTAALGSWLGKHKTELPRRRDIGSNLRDRGGNDSNWPVMVVFRNLADPKSVEEVVPESVAVKRIVVETTSDQVTTGIGKRLLWLSTQRGSLVKRPPGDFAPNPPLGYLLTEMNFSTELFR